jgi:hypothetical protein
MKVKPMLGDWEIPRIAAIRTIENRSVIEMRVPGMVGSLYQDLNSVPTRIEISGSLFGDDARDEFLQKVREKFKAGEPVTFVADIITATDVQYVVVEKLEFTERGTAPDETSYAIVLKESPLPPPPPDPLGGLDSDLLDQAGGFLDSVSGALSAIDGLVGIPELKDPTAPLAGTLNGVKSALTGLGSVSGDLKNLFGG